MDYSILLMFGAILVVGALMYIFIALSKRQAKLDVQAYRSKWLSIEQSLDRDNPATYPMAVLNADSLLDKALQAKNIPGKTMGERMKKFEWSNANSVWSAHKLRNRIAHDHDVKLDYRQVRLALNSFKQALKDVGAI